MGRHRMVKLQFRYVVEDTDRHGNVRLYFRRKGQRKVRLQGMVGSAEFNATYQKLLAGENVVQKSTTAVGEKAVHGSFKWLCEGYYKTAEFKQLDPRTKVIRRRILDGLCGRFGTRPINRLEPRNIRALRDQRSE